MIQKFAGSIIIIPIHVPGLPRRDHVFGEGWIRSRQNCMHSIVLDKIISALFMSLCAMG